MRGASAEGLPAPRSPRRPCVLAHCVGFCAKQSSADLFQRESVLAYIVINQYLPILQTPIKHYCNTLQAPIMQIVIYLYSREWRLTAPNSVLFNSAIRAPKFHHTRDYTRTIRGDPENKVSASFALNLQAFCMIQACSGSESPAGAVAVKDL